MSTRGCDTNPISGNGILFIYLFIILINIYLVSALEDDVAGVAAAVRVDLPRHAGDGGGGQAEAEQRGRHLRVVVTRHHRPLLVNTYVGDRAVNEISRNFAQLSGHLLVKSA